MIWISFILAISTLIIISRKNQWLGMLASGLILGLTNLPLYTFLMITWQTISDGSLFLLATAVSLIPLIGGIVQQSGMLERMVSSLRMNRKIFLMLSPALVGFMPIPGGALLSCPLISKAGNDIKKVEYVVINLWFRHLLIIIYPLGSLLICTKMADVSLYSAVLYLSPAPLIMGLLGYFFFLRKIKGNMSDLSQTEDKNRFRAISTPIIIFLAAPLIHILLMWLAPFSMMEIPMLIGLTFSLGIAICCAKTDYKGLIKAFSVMKPYRFFLLIIGIFFFLNVFTATDIASKIAEFTFPKHVLIIVLAFVISFFTGRIQVGFSVILPIFLARYGTLDLLHFTLFYIAVFMGYLTSPIHPCLSLSLEYFETTFAQVMKRMAAPVLIIMALLYVFAMLI
jgi:integral membrane protein (TIGR00529 family)